jgi:hypothetical protein
MESATIGLRFILNLNIAQEILHSSEMEELHAPCVELGWLINDVISWNKEQVCINCPGSLNLVVYGSFNATAERRYVQYCQPYPDPQAEKYPRCYG